MFLGLRPQVSKLGFSSPRHISRGKNAFTALSLEMTALKCHWLVGKNEHFLLGQTSKRHILKKKTKPRAIQKFTCWGQVGSNTSGQTQIL
jgi:hypothetical protein